MFDFLCTGVVAIHCSRGERVDTLREGHDVCVPCKDFTFMAEDNHPYKTCKQCTFIEDPDVEVFVSLCNKTHDSVIFCTSGFYRRRASNDRQADRCEKCTECEFPTRACEGYYDTVCCHPLQEAAFTAPAEVLEMESPNVCQPGQFLEFWSKECLPCPAGTFMSAHNHTYNQCLKCEQLSENNATHAIITRPCSRTAPTLFGCKDGYFRDPTQESLQTEVPCTPCRICQLSLTECGMFHDAVCDDHDTLSSAAPANHTQSTGVTGDADIREAGESWLNGTKDSNDRNQSQNPATECQKPASLNVVTLSITCVTLFVTLGSTFYRIFWNDKPNANPKYSCRKIASSIFTTHKLVDCCVCALLSVALIICILLKTVNTQICDVGTEVFVVITLAAAQIYNSVINMARWGRRPPNKQHVIEEGQHVTIEEAPLEWFLNIQPNSRGRDSYRKEENQHDTMGEDQLEWFLNLQHNSQDRDSYRKEESQCDTLGEDPLDVPLIIQPNSRGRDSHGKEESQHDTMGEDQLGLSLFLRPCSRDRDSHGTEESQYDTLEEDQLETSLNIRLSSRDRDSHGKEENQHDTLGEDQLDIPLNIQPNSRGRDSHGKEENEHDNLGENQLDVPLNIQPSSQDRGVQRAEESQHDTRRGSARSGPTYTTS